MKSLLDLQFRLPVNLKASYYLIIWIFVKMLVFLSGNK